MKAAVIGQVDGSFDRVEPVANVVPMNGHELAEQIDVTGVKRTPDGLDIDTGRAASQTVRDREAVTFTNGSISLETESEISTQYTEFFAVPGEFVGVASSSGTFLFDLVAERTDTTISRCEFDLDGLVEAFPDATPWKVGFYGHEGPADNGVIHGESVLEDSVFGTALESSKKNQLGLKLDRDGTEIKMAVTRSGYVEVYQPSDIDTAEFAAFVREDILPHAA